MDRFLRRFFITTFIFALLGCFAANAGAKQLKADAIMFDPATDSGRYLTVHDAQTLMQWRFSTGVYFDYSHDPIELRDVTTGTRSGVVNSLAMAHIQAALGITDWFEAGVSLPVVMYENFLSPNANPGTPRQTHTGLSDIRLETKFRLLDNFIYPVGVAVIPFITFPTGSSEYFLGNGKVTGGGKVAVEGNILNMVFISGNIGYQYVPGVSQYYGGNGDAIMDDLLLFGAGVRGDINDMWSLIAEINGETVAKNAFKSYRQTPILAHGGAVFTPRFPGNLRGLSFTVAAGAGLTKGIGNPNFQILGGINYRQPRIVALEDPKSASVDARIEEKIVITQKIHFEFNRAEIRPISFPILDDVVTLLNQNPQMTRIEVEGHTDSVGGDAYNERLSKMRAASVVNYLVEHGIARSRLVPVGYGESRPIASNETTEGRAKNRRTEFTVVDSSAQ